MDLEPDAEAVVALDAPAVGEALEQHEPVAAGGAGGRREGHVGLEADPLVAQAHAHRVPLDGGLHRELVVPVAAGVADAVGGQLRHEQLDVGEPALGERVSELLAHGATGTTGCGGASAEPANGHLVPTCPESAAINRRSVTNLTQAAERPDGFLTRYVASAMPQPKRVEVEVQGRTLSLSNLDKVLYPAAGFAKGHVIDYYTRVAPAVLPHLRGRALTLKRYPNGVDAQFFYEKNAPAHRPDWVRTARVPIRTDGRTIDFVLADDLPTLVWLANLADLELHTSLARASDPRAPTILAFDLDPGPPATIVECAEVALWLREAFDHLGLEGFPKTSGSKGMQVYVPLNVPASYDRTKRFSQALAQLLERRHPELVVSEMRKDLRHGKVFVDWSQNDEHKTTVAAYSLRAKDRPTVSTPLDWEEVEAVTESRDADDLAFTSADVLERVTEHGDLFAPVEELEQPLPDL